MDYENMSLVELKQLAKENEIKNISKLKKEEIIVVLQNIENEANNNKKETIEKTTVKTIDGYKLTNDDQIAEGILEVLPDGYGFLRGDNYLSTPQDIYISPVQIRRFKLDTGDRIKGISRQWG